MVRPRDVVGTLDCRPEFRATAVEYLNDSRELIHGLTILRDELIAPAIAAAEADSAQDGPRSTSTPKEKAEFLRKFCEVIDRVEIREYPRHIHCYVTSFSENPDLLSQWRGYCGGLNGFAIGIDVACMPEEAEAKLKQVKYSGTLRDSSDIMNLASLWLRRFVLDRSQAPRPSEQLLDQYLRELAVFAAQFKHEGFGEEAEWRIIRRGSDGANYRSRATQLVPYVTWDLPPESVVGVYVGPGPSQNENHLAVKSLLHSYGYHSAAENVILSPTPFK